MSAKVLAYMQLEESRAGGMEEQSFSAGRGLGMPAYSMYG